MALDKAMPCLHGHGIGSVALIGRAPDSKSGGCRFEPCLTRFATGRAMSN
jgi:hypothetical protein